jgi:hypothetical protein
VIFFRPKKGGGRGGGGGFLGNFLGENLGLNFGGKNHQNHNIAKSRFKVKLKLFVGMVPLKVNLKLIFKIIL